MARHRRQKAEREAVLWELRRAKATPPQTPCLCVLTRYSPATRPMDDDNLAGAFKAIRDALAGWIGVDDGDTARLRFRYAQERGSWAVRIEFHAQEVPTC